MSTYTLKKTDYEHIVLKTKENSVSIYQKENTNNNSSVSLEKIYLLNVEAKKIKSIQYKLATSTEKKGNTNAFIIFIILSIICFILIPVTQKYIGDTSTVFIVFAIVFLIAGICNRPSEERKMGQEFSLIDENNNKLYSINTMLTLEQYEEIVNAIRAIQ